MDDLIRGLVLLRDKYRCVRCGKDVMSRPYSVHHRKLRSQGGTDDLANLITLCGHGTTGCHYLVHSQRKSHGEPGGYVVPSWADPTEVGVVYHPNRFVMLKTAA